MIFDKYVVITIADWLSKLPNGDRPPGGGSVGPSSDFRGQNRGGNSGGDFPAQFSATHSTGSSDIWIAGSGVGSDIWTAGSLVSDSGATALRTASLRADGLAQICCHT